MSFFKSIFGPTKDEVWAALNTQIGGTTVPGGFWKGDRLQATAGDWTVTFDEYNQTMMAGSTPIIIPHTRIRAPFPNPSAFRFSIHRSSIFTAIGKAFGMQDIEIGDFTFDEKFVIKGNNEVLVRQLLSSARLRDLVRNQPKIQLSIQDDEGWFGSKYPPQVDVLVFDVAESIREVTRLKDLYDIFAEILEQLSRLGIAEKGDGAVRY